MLNDKTMRDALQKQWDAVEGSEVFCQLYSPKMADFLEDPAPAIQLAIAILLDKPIILACLPGRHPPAKLLGIADAVVYGDEATLAKGIQDAVEKLAPET